MRIALMSSAATLNTASRPTNERMYTGAPGSGTALVDGVLKSFLGMPAASCRCGSAAAGEPKSDRLLGYRPPLYRAMRLRNVAGDSPACLLKKREKYAGSAKPR